jgi:hypothetical protein
MAPDKKLMNCMLRMVMENPMQLTMVRELPFDSPGAFCATSVEKSGESAITTSPQKTRKISRATTELLKRKRGERRQQQQDRNNARVATGFGP